MRHRIELVLINPSHCMFLVAKLHYKIEECLLVNMCTQVDATVSQFSDYITTGK